MTRPRARTRPPLWPLPYSLRFAALGLFCTILLTCFLVSDTHSRDLADELIERGAWVTATDVQVLVTKSSDRYGTDWNVDGVRAQLPGSAAPSDLELVLGPDDELPPHSPTGWQAPTNHTGYETPLRVRVLTNGDGTVRHAVAETDLTYWMTDNHDVQVDLALGAVALLVTAAGVGAFARRWRRYSPPAEPAGRHRV